MKLLKEFLKFLKKPELKDPVSLSLKQSALLLVRSLLVYFLFILVCTLLFIPLSIFNLIPDLPNRTATETMDIIVIAPILEELLFRLPLKNFFRNVFVTMALAFYALTKSYLGVSLAVMLSVTIIVLPYIPGFINRIEHKVNVQIKKIYPFLFYFIALSFGFLHLTNIENLTTAHYFVSPVIVLYQILLGLYLGFIRVKYKWGIIFSILIHALFNAIPILIKIM